MSFTDDPKKIKEIVGFTKEQGIAEGQALDRYIRETRKLTAPQAAILLINYLAWLGVNPIVVANDLKEIQKAKENERRIR